MYRSLLGVLIGLMVSGAAVAAEVDDTATVMGEVVVTATRQVEDLATVPANVTVIDRAEIEQSSAQNIPELLRTVPGVLVNDIAGNGRNYTVDLRGFGETASLNTLVLIDGRRVNQADLSGVDWVLIPKERVERIEIVRGSRGSVLYGDNATGGVINIITKGGNTGTSVAAGAQAGSYETFAGYTSVSTENDSLAAAASANYRTSDGYRDNSDITAKDLGLKLDYDVSEMLTLRFNSGYHKDKTGLPAAVSNVDLDSGISRRSTNAPDDQVETEDWYLLGGVQYYLNDNSYIDVDASFRNREAVFSYDSIGASGVTEIDTVSLSPKVVMAQSVFGMDANILFGIDYQKDEEDIFTDNFTGANSRELSKESFGYYAHADVAITEQLSVSGGVRKEKAEFDFNWVSGSESSSKTLDEDLFTVGATYKLSDNAILYTNYAKSYRSPVLDEFYSLFNDTFDAGLDAQTSNNVEIGMRLDLSDKTSLSFNIFHIVTADEIFLNPATYTNENLDGDSIRQGVELSFSTTVRDILINGGYTFRDTEVDGGPYNGKELPNVPEHQLTVGLQKTFDNQIQLGLNGVYVGKRHYISDFDNDLNKLDDYFYTTGKISYLLDNGKLYLAVNNILDEKYSEYVVDYGFGFEGWYPSPEINFVIGADFSF